jgi:serine/threonine-protein kinase RsbT
MSEETVVAIAQSSDLVQARSQGREIARQAGLGLADQTRLATAISEITRNVLKYAQTGTCTVSDASDLSQVKVAVVVEDEGPGIDDIELALSDGYSTGKSMGVGLPGTRRITTELEVESRPGYTRVRFFIARPRSH